jgi:S1-C subfamily serine protease
MVVDPVRSCAAVAAHNGALRRGGQAGAVGAAVGIRHASGDEARRARCRTDPPTMQQTMYVRRIAVVLLFAVVSACRGDAGTVPFSTAAADPGSFGDVVEAVMPAIVLIEAEARPREGAHPLLPQLSPDELFPVGIGSGVIYADDGLILTNNHVVQDAERVTVTLYDRRQFEAEVVARDPSTDVAVVRIPGNGYPVARMADSDGLRLGDRVIALGSPLGLQFTVTAGIVSGTGRALGILQGSSALREGEAAPLESFIQTDAAIGPGNSGGPLVDVNGAVVGINTAVARPDAGFASFGFAIPANLARRVAEQLVRYGEVRRPYLGVLLDGVTTADAEVYGLERAEGAEVKFVEPGSPAADAGVEVGDVIVAIDGTPTASVAELQSVLAQLDAAGATLRVIRYGETLELPVRPGLVRSGVRPAEQRAATTEPDIVDRLGFSARTANGGVIVTGVRPMSAAARAGVRPGQRIVRVNRNAVRAAGDVLDAVRAADRTVVSLLVDDAQIGRTIINYRF